MQKTVPVVNSDDDKIKQGLSTATQRSQRFGTPEARLQHSQEWQNSFPICAATNIKLISWDTAAITGMSLSLKLPGLWFNLPGRIQWVRSWHNNTGARAQGEGCPYLLRHSLVSVFPHFPHGCTVEIQILSRTDVTNVHFFHRFHTLQWSLRVLSSKSHVHVWGTSFRLKKKEKSRRLKANKILIFMKFMRF